MAILRDLKLDDLRAEGFGEDQIVNLSAAGEATLILPNSLDVRGSRVVTTI